MSGILMLLKIIAAIVVGLGAATFGGMIGFVSDFGQNEGPFDRVLMMSAFYSIGGLCIGYLLPRFWYFSIAVAWHPLQSIVRIITDFNSFMEFEEHARWIILNVSVVSPVVALLAGYVGYRVHRSTSPVPVQNWNMPFRHKTGLLVGILLFFAYLLANIFLAEEEPRISKGLPPYTISLPTELHEAAEKGDLVQIRRLIEKGEDVNILDTVGRTPLHYAVGEQRVTAVELLLSYNASPDIKDRQYGVTPLHWAVGSGNLAIVNLLAPKMDNIDALNNEGVTAAMIAADDKNKKILEVLISHGAVINSYTQ